MCLPIKLIYYRKSEHIKDTKMGRRTGGGFSRSRSSTPSHTKRRFSQSSPSTPSTPRKHTSSTSHSHTPAKSQPRTPQTSNNSFLRSVGAGMLGASIVNIISGLSHRSDTRSLNIQEQHRHYADDADVLYRRYPPCQHNFEELMNNTEDIQSKWDDLVKCIETQKEAEEDTRGYS